MTWPPTLATLKVDMKIDAADTREDVRLQENLDAAVDFVEEQRAGDFRFDPTNPDQFNLPDPTAKLILGTLRLAARWKTRPRSPDGLVDLGELGSARVPAYDSDIERLLAIGRYRKPVFG